MGHGRTDLFGTPHSARRQRATLALTSLFASSLLAAGLVLAACGPTAEPQVVVETVIVEQTRIVEEEGEPVTVVETVEVEVVVTPESAQPEGPATGECCDVYRIALFADPGTTNYWSFLGADSSAWTGMVIGDQAASLYTLSDVTFQFVPSLAREFAEPVDNGDGTWTITVPMVEDATWSDGVPITAHDYVFTYNACVDLALTQNWYQLCYRNDLDATARALGDYTVQFTYLNQAPSLGTWQNGLAQFPILPRHFWGDAVAEAYALIEGLEEPTVEMPEGIDCSAEELSEEDATTCAPYLTEWDPYEEAFVNARAVLYGADATGAPVAGGYTTGKLEPGAFAIKEASENYYFEGAEIVEYDDGTWMLIHPNGSTHRLYGDAAGEETLRFTDGPHAPSVVFSIYGSQDAAFLALADGKVDYVANPVGLTRGMQEMVEERGEGIETYVNADFSMYYLAFNLRRYPFSEYEFRQAVDIVMDKEFVADSVLGGVVYPMYSTMPPGNVFWHNPDVPRPYVGWSREDRVNEAVRVLKEAGWSWDLEPAWSEDLQDVVPGEGLVMPNGEPMPEATILGPGPAYDPIRATFNQWTSEWLRELGMPVESELTGINTIAGPVFADSTFDMYILGWGLGSVAYPGYFEAFWYSRQDTAVSGGFNTTGYSNPEYDALIDEFLTTVDLERARELVFDMQVMLADQRPYITLYYTQVTDMARDNLIWAYTENLGGLPVDRQSTTRPEFK